MEVLLRHNYMFCLPYGKNCQLSNYFRNTCTADDGKNLYLDQKKFARQNFRSLENLLVRNFIKFVLNSRFRSGQIL